MELGTRISQTVRYISIRKLSSLSMNFLFYFLLLTKMRDIRTSSVRNEVRVNSFYCINISFAYLERKGLFFFFGITQEFDDKG